MSGAFMWTGPELHPEWQNLGRRPLWHLNRALKRFALNFTSALSTALFSFTPSWMDSFSSALIFQTVWSHSHDVLVSNLKVWPKYTRSIVLKRLLIVRPELLPWISSSQPTTHPTLFTSSQSTSKIIYLVFGECLSRREIIFSFRDGLHGNVSVLIL